MNKGFITVDFIFGLLLVSALSAVLLSLCFTMAVVEVAQYVSFASARTYFGAHLTSDLQQKLSDQKFEEAIKLPFLQGLFKGNFFDLKYVRTGDFREEYPPRSGNEDRNDTFIGTRLELTVKILNFRLPFFGTVAEEEGFKFNIQSFLAREPSFEECHNFEKQRLNKIIEKWASTRGLPIDENAYKVIMDNGC